VWCLRASRDRFGVAIPGVAFGTRSFTRTATIFEKIKSR